MRLRVCLVLGTALMLAACGSASAPSTPTPSPVVTTTTTTVSSTAAVDIPSADYASGKTLTNFAPSNVSILVGGVVTWTNNDIVTHVSASGSQWASPIAPGGTFKRTFNAVGSFEYICTIHPSMSGTIVVK